MHTIAIRLHAMTPKQINIALEFLGAVTGIIGALLNALDASNRPFAFALWVISSVAFTVYGYRTKAPALAAMSVTYTAINIMGLLRL